MARRTKSAVRKKATRKTRRAPKAAPRRSRQGSRRSPPQREVGEDGEVERFVYEKTFTPESEKE